MQKTQQLIYGCAYLRLAQSRPRLAQLPTQNLFAKANIAPSAGGTAPSA
ncbi:hypothetical protein A2U01_0099588, partial [Trifolium medium]|nr:hypothetical protein [Trifolium medium]